MINLSLNLFDRKSNWKAPTGFPSLQQAKRIAIDLETYDPRLLELGCGAVRRDGFIAGVAIATDYGFKGYYPVRQAKGNFSSEIVFDWLRRELSSPIPKVGANVLYDLEWLHTVDVHPRGPFYDVQFAEALIDEEKEHTVGFDSAYGLDALAWHYLKERKQDEVLKEFAIDNGFDPKGQLAFLPAEAVGEYAEGDVQQTLRVFHRQIEQLNMQNLWEVFLMECKLIPILLKMKMRGVRVDVDQCERVRGQLQKKEKEIMLSFKDFTKRPFNPSSSNQIGAVCDELGLPYPRTDKGNPSFTKQFLTNTNDPFYKRIVDWREVNKLRTTFIEGAFLENANNGRIHCSFHPLRQDDNGTRSGRFSCTGPNLQQAPSRNELAHLIRSCIVPEDGCPWDKFDYSQQEPRVLVHYAMGEQLEGSREAGQRWIDDPHADFYMVIANLAGISRFSAKTVYLAMSYGMGVVKLSRNLGISVGDAEVVLGTFHEGAPFVKQLAENLSKCASQQGWISTLAGRRRHFDFWEPPYAKDEGLRAVKGRERAEAKWPTIWLRRAHTHKALNALIQGGSADMTKLAMIACYEAGLPIPHLQIHDELDFSLDDPVRQRRDITAIMENCVKLRVPILAENSTGTNWGDAK